jgi:hypothetical protein
LAAGIGAKEVVMNRNAAEATQTGDPYEILGMPRTATAGEIKKRFRHLAKELHPDANKDDPEAADRFVELNAARAILENEDKRRAFDRGEIDARGNPSRRRRGISYRRSDRPRSGINHIAIRVAIAALILAATPTLIIGHLAKQGAFNTEANSTSSGLGADGRQANAEPHLIFQHSVPRAPDGAFPLGVQVSGGSAGMTLEIGGAPEGMTISPGRAVGTGRWRIAATDIGSAVIHPSQGFDGPADLDIELRRSDDTVADHRSLHVRWAPSPAVADRAEPPASASAVSNQRARKKTVHAGSELSVARVDREQLDFLVKRGVGLITEGDIVAARILLQRAAELRDARAAFALGATYDPIMLTMLQAHGVTADARVALDWYKKASEFGSHEASQRLNVLAALR